jgi:hypothetical protein
VLARLDQTGGVQSSYTNESGTLIWLSLRPGADPAEATAAVGRALREEVGDRVPVRLEGRAAAAALREQPWRDKSWLTPQERRDKDQVPADPATATPTPGDGVSVLLVVLLLGCAAVGLGLLWRRHRKRRAGHASSPGRLARGVKATKVRPLGHLGPA